MTNFNVSERDRNNKSVKCVIKIENGKVTIDGKEISVDDSYVIEIIDESHRSICEHIDRKNDDKIAINEISIDILKPVDKVMSIMEKNYANINKLNSAFYELWNNDYEFTYGKVGRLISENLYKYLFRDFVMETVETVKFYDHYLKFCNGAQNFAHIILKTLKDNNLIYRNEWNLLVENIQEYYPRSINLFLNNDVYDPNSPNCDPVHLAWYNVAHHLAFVSRNYDDFSNFDNFADFDPTKNAPIDPVKLSRYMIVVNDRDTLIKVNREATTRFAQFERCKYKFSHI